MRIITISTSETKLPADKLDKATKLQVNLFGSLSATGKGHGTERAALGTGGRAGNGRPEIPGRPARQAGSGVPGEAGQQVHRREPQGRHLRRDEGDFKHPNTMTVKLLAGNDVLLEQNSLGGRRIHRVERVTPPTKSRYPFHR
jgi:L-serine dehydratase